MEEKPILRMIQGKFEFVVYLNKTVIRDVMNSDKNHSIGVIKYHYLEAIFECLEFSKRHNNANHHLVIRTNDEEWM